jgi:hypothetical protein
MMATTITWIYADRLKTNPERRHKVKGRTSFAFSDVRRNDTDWTFQALRHDNTIISASSALLTIEVDRIFSRFCLKGAGHFPDD